MLSPAIVGSINNIEKVVELINAAPSLKSPLYKFIATPFGILSAEQLAGQYAYLKALSDGDTCTDHMESFIADLEAAGAVFDEVEACVHSLLTRRREQIEDYERRHKNDK